MSTPTPEITKQHRTPAQREASRRNGAKSRGPRTAAGKFTSSLNSFQHGAHSQITTILPEDSRRFDALFKDFLDRFAPRDHVDLELIEQMACASWRRRRHSAVLNAIWNQEIERLTQQPSAQPREGIDLAAQAYENLASAHTHLHSLELSESREILKFHRATKALRQLYEWREKLEKQTTANEELTLIP